jgi:hypothetical protein
MSKESGQAAVGFDAQAFQTGYRRIGILHRAQLIELVATGLTFIFVNGHTVLLADINPIIVTFRWTSRPESRGDNEWVCGPALPAHKPIHIQAKKIRVEIITNPVGGP